METPFVSSPAQSRTVSKKALAITLLAVVGLVGCVCAVHVSSTTMKSNNNIEGLFAQWKAANNKTYGGAESKLRLSIFENNNRIVEEHNAKESTYKLGLTQFADLTDKEFASLYLGATKNPNSANNCPEPHMRRLEDVQLETTVDWRQKGRVGPVKNQAQCGSCWAFSTVGALEGLYAAEKGEIVSFSEQQLVDCSGSYGNYGCNGGWVQDALHYVIEHGIALESAYPYKGVDGKCKTVEPAFKPTGCTNVPTQSVDALKAALQNGPVSVYIQADTRAFQLYHSGVLNDLSCFSEGQIDHAVLAVGYDEESWIVKNSWAETWGEKGYIRISTDVSQDASGICGILHTADVYPTL